MTMIMKNIVKNLLVCLVVCVSLTAGHASAAMTPTPLSGDTRLVTFEYDQENTYLVLARPRAHTHIMLPEGELLESVMAGDTASWEINPTKNLKHLFIKPKYEDTETTLTLVTTSKTFQLVIRSTGEGRKWYQQVSWEVPKGFAFDYTDKIETSKDRKTSVSDDRRLPDQKSMAIDPTKLHYGYTISGNEKFRPTQVFDDGKMIWLKMPANLVELPAFFAKDGGDLVLVNYVVKGEFVLVQQLVDTLVLKIGKSEISIKRDADRSWGGSSNNWNN